VATLGSDTGGSIRQPASFCGVVGVLPTYGRVSRYGLIAFASSLDRVGPFAANVRDAATLLGVIAGHDPKDATSSTAPVPDYAAESDKPAAGLRIGVPAEYFAEGPRSGGARSHRERHQRAESGRLYSQAGIRAAHQARLALVPTDAIRYRRNAHTGVCGSRLRLDCTTGPLSAR